MMKINISIFLIALQILSLSALTLTKSPKSSISPLPLFLDTQYQGHPYRNANLGRDKSHWDVFSQRYKIGNKGHYEMMNPFAKGRYSLVLNGLHVPTKQPVAMKMFMHHLEDRMLKEMLMLKDLKDAPNFIPLRDVLKEEEGEKIRMIFIFDMFPAKLSEELFPSLNKYEAKFCVYEILRTLDYAHSKGIMHRDIKPDNILFDTQKMQVRVIDWGQSEYYRPGEEYYTRVSSLHYKAPELLLNYTTYDYSIDIWSTGCVLAEIIFKKEHFFQANHEPNPKDPRYSAEEAALRAFGAHLDAIAKIRGTLELKRYANKFEDLMNLDILKYVENYKKVSLKKFVKKKKSQKTDVMLLDLLNKMLQYDHTKRITASEALKHPYFAEIRDKLK